MLLHLNACVCVCVCVYLEVKVPMLCSQYHRRQQVHTIRTANDRVKRLLCTHTHMTHIHKVQLCLANQCNAPLGFPYTVFNVCWIVLELQCLSPRRQALQAVHGILAACMCVCVLPAGSP